MAVCYSGTLSVATAPLFANALFRAAAEAMRRILVENARRKLRVRHGGDMTRVDLDEAELVAALPPDALLGLNDAIENLARHDRPAAD